jgi:O-methyltransferase
MPRLITAENVTQIMRELGELGVLTTQVTWPTQPLPDHALYQPYARGWATFSPWRADPQIRGMVQRMHDQGVTSLVDTDRAWTLACAFRQTATLPGEVWECGVYQGGSATLFKLMIQDRVRQSGDAPCTLRLFDSFQGLPQTQCGLDRHHAGDFADTSLEKVRETVGAEAWTDFRAGWIPATFAGLEDAAIRLAHVDVDLYQPILDCCEFIYPRLVPGGMMVFDDYGLASCPGARAAVDNFFRGRPESPFPLLNGQCVVTRLPGAPTVGRRRQAALTAATAGTPSPTAAPARSGPTA